MRNKVLSLLALCALAVCLTGCLDHAAMDYTPIEYTVSSDAFVVNAGNPSSGISGSLSSIDLNTLECKDAVFQSKNGRSLGMTPNDAIFYGDKMYIAVTGANTIEVIDKNTLKSLAQIDTEELLGDSLGHEPRRLVSAYGKVYFTTYGGCVASIDTTSFALKDKFEVGSYPEGIALDSYLLYVANSDSSKGNNASINVINLRTDEITTITEDVNNPTDLALCNGSMFVLDGTTYNDDKTVKRECDSLAVIDSARIVHVQKAQFMTSLNTSSFTPRLYLAYYEDGAAKYLAYTPYGTANPTGGRTNTFISDGPKYPAAMVVDPLTGNVFIAAYNVGSDGKPDYSGIGYVNIYDYSGNAIKTGLTCGIGPARIAIKHALKYY